MRDPRKRRSPTDVGSIIRTVLRDLDIPEDTAQRGRAMIAWDDIAGTGAAHSRPINFRGKTLVVEVSHPSWMTEFSMRKAELLLKLREIVGEGVVEDIRFTLMREQNNQ